MSLARPRYALINSKVEQLLSNARVLHAPVPVDRLAEHAGAQVVFKDFRDEIAGLLVRRPGEIVIGVDSKHPQSDALRPSARQRFTIAHELGHLLLHEGEEVHVDKDFRVNLRSPLSSTAVSVEEIEANTFAATLLMPIKFLMLDLDNEIIDIQDSELIQRLAQKYEVSIQAMTYRLMNVLKLR